MVPVNFDFDWPVVSEEKTFEQCGQKRRQRRSTEHEYTENAPCEPNGSEELKMMVDGRTTTDGRTDGHRVPTYPISSPASLRLR